MASTNPKSDGAHSEDESRSDGPAVLAPDDEADDMELDESYLGRVTEITAYGVFVGLTNPNRSDLTGLAHESNLPPLTKPADFEVGELAVVNADAMTNDGPELRMAYSESVNPDGEQIPDADPTTNPDGGGGIDAIDRAVGEVVDEIDRAVGEVSERPDGEGLGEVDVPADSEAIDSINARIGAMDDAIWELHDEIADLRTDRSGEPGTDVGSFAASPVKDAAVELLHLADRGHAADTVVKEKLRDGRIRFEVTLEPDAAGGGAS